MNVGFAYDGDADRCLCVDEKYVDMVVNVIKENGYVAG